MKILLPLALLFILVSCNKIEYETVYIGLAEGPSVTKVNEDISITIKYGTPSSDGHFDRFIETEHTTTRYIQAIARFGHDATAAHKIHTVYYSFKASSSGTYYLKFKSGPSTYINKTVVVTD
ncbi:MAG: hypothetical protein AB8B56_19510 [Crocinitomicaceae bacterium]